VKACSEPYADVSNVGSFTLRMFFPFSGKDLHKYGVSSPGILFQDFGVF
jgi:hypothetical protein